MTELEKMCLAYLEGYICAMVTNDLLPGEVLESDLDNIKELAVKCMEEYISHQNLSDKDKEELKRSHKLWADMTLGGLKQRLRECGKIR